MQCDEQRQMDDRATLPAHCTYSVWDKAVMIAKTPIAPPIAGETICDDDAAALMFAFSLS